MRLLHGAAPALTAGALMAGAAVASAGGAVAAGNPNAPGQVKHTEQAVCSSAPAGYARCNAHVRTDSDAVGQAPASPGTASSAGAGANSTVGNNGAYDPMYLESAYNDPAYSWGSNGYYGSSSAGSNQIVAIVDAYDDSTAASDLATYRSFFHLPACATPTLSGAPIVAGSGCSFYKVNQSGQQTAYPTGNSGWAQEESLDVDMVSAMCPNCTIVLVEANSSSIADLGQSVNEAATLGAKVVSNSYGSSEYGSEVSDAAYYSHTGVAVVASSGDNGYGVEFPAAAPTVTAVGGTSLNQVGDGGLRNATEAAWSGAGSGCSAYEPQPTWQKPFNSACANRMVADVSADADPNTPVWVYDRGWYMFGGTSVASPIIGSIYAVAGAVNSGTSGTETWPSLNSKAALNDVTGGSNGNCSTYLCNAGPSYDGPTGLGTPEGSNAFTGTSTAPAAPGTPQGLTATAGSASVTVAWQPPSTGGLSVTYSLYRSTGIGTGVDPTNATTTTLVSSTLTGTSYTDSGLTAGTTYNYAVVAHNAAGPSGLSSTVSAAPTQSTQPLPGQITNLHASTSRTSGVTLTWSAPSNAGTTYYLYRATSNSGLSSTSSTKVITVTCTASVGTTCTTNDSNNGTVHNQVYYYQVAATNGSGTGPRSNISSARAR